MALPKDRLTNTFDREINGARIRLHNSDCISGMQDLPEASVDVFVTSPPYNIGIKYNGYDDTMERENYLSWMGDWADVVLAKMSDSGSLFLNVGGKPTDPWGPFQLLMQMQNRGFHLQNIIHWVKSIAIKKDEVGNYPHITDDVVVGHYKPINSKRFLNDCHEYIFHLTKHGTTELDRLAVGVGYQDKSNVSRWGNAANDVHCRGNTWFIPYKTINNRTNDRPHPATFPVELPRRCIMLHGVERTKHAVDPFMGIGTSAEAAASLGVEFTGYELCKEYFETACERLEGL